MISIDNIDGVKDITFTDKRIDDVDCGTNIFDECDKKSNLICTRK